MGAVFLAFGALVAGRGGGQLGWGWASFFLGRRETGQYQGVANKCLRLGPKMVL